MATRSRAAPEPIQPITRSPGSNPPTPGPTLSTTPANSEAGENGNGGLCWYLPAISSVSKKLSAAARMATTASPGPATGGGMSLISRSSGPPKRLHRTAFMVRQEGSKGRPSYHVAVPGRGAAVPRRGAAVGRHAAFTMPPSPPNRLNRGRGSRGCRGHAADDVAHSAGRHGRRPGRVAGRGPGAGEEGGA